MMRATKVTCALLFAIALLAAPAARAAISDKELQDTLIGLERQSWVAWQASDGKFFDSFLSADHIELSALGPLTKAAVVGYVASRQCKVASYSLSDFRFVRLSETSAFLVYKAEQETTCGTQNVPSPAWATSVFSLRDGRWQNVLYEHLPAAEPSRPAPHS